MTELSAGFDIRADLSRVTDMTDLVGSSAKFAFTFPEMGHKSVTLFPKGGRVLIPTGLHVAIPEGYEIQIRPRSGLALKHGITVLNSPGTIDNDFLGEIGLIMINTDPSNDFEITDGDRIAQGILCRVEQIEWEKVDTIDKLGNTVRGQGGFNSTGKN